MANRPAPGESAARDYVDEVRDIFSDKRGRIIPALPLRRLVLDLTNARNAVEFKCTGDFLFLDRNTTGLISVSLRNPQEDPMPMAALDIIEGVPMDRISITHAAQPGLVANLWYGYHARFRATSNSLSGITSTVNVLELGYNYGASFQSNTSIAVNTNETIVAPASNVNGMTIVNASHGHGVAATGDYLTELLLKSGVAPASSIDGDMILVNAVRSQTLAGLHSSNVVLQNRLRVTAGKGYYRRASITGEGNILFGTQYTLP